MSMQYTRPRSGDFRSRKAPIHPTDGVGGPAGTTVVHYTQCGTPSQQAASVLKIYIYFC